MHSKENPPIETHFHLDDFINRQNCCIWSLENSSKTNASEIYHYYYVLRSGGIIRQYFFEDVEDNALTVADI